MISIKQNQFSFFALTNRHYNIKSIEQFINDLPFFFIIKKLILLNCLTLNYTKKFILNLQHITKRKI